MLHKSTIEGNLYYMSTFRQYGQIEKQRWEESEKRREEKRREEKRREGRRRDEKKGKERARRKNTQVREKVEKSRSLCFSNDLWLQWVEKLAH